MDMHRSVERLPSILRVSESIAGVGACAVLTLLAPSSAWAGPLTIPADLVAGERARADDVNSKFTAVATEVTDNANDIATRETIARHNTDIATLETIASHDADIATLETIASHDADVTTLETSANHNADIATVTDLINALVPVGTVIAYAGAIVPFGWLECNGDTVSRTALPELFNAIGVSHGGGDLVSSFNLPDYRGRFLRGVDSGAGRDPDAGLRKGMNFGGNSGDTVGSVQSHQFYSHRHRQNTNTWAGAALMAQSVAGTVDIASNYTNYQGGKETRPVNAYVNWIIRCGSNDSC